MTEITFQEKILTIMALRDRLRYLDQIGIPEDNELVKETKKLLHKMEGGS